MHLAEADNAGGAGLARQDSGAAETAEDEGVQGAPRLQLDGREVAAQMKKFIVPASQRRALL
jgi:hypothetical protein